METLVGGLVKQPVTAQEGASNKDRRRLVAGTWRHQQLITLTYSEEEQDAILNVVPAHWEASRIPFSTISVTGF